MGLKPPTKKERLMIILLREATYADMPLVMAWHSNPIIQKGFYTLGKDPRPLNWEEHYEWWTLTTKDWKKFIVILVENNIAREVGIVRVSNLEDFCPNIGFTIGEVSLWGKGVGKQAVSLALDWLNSIGKKYVNTTVLTNNQRAVGLLEGLGFESRGEARKGEIWMQKKL